MNTKPRLAGEYKPNDRIELDLTTDLWTNLRPGNRGTITYIDTQGPDMVIGVRWDSGSTLAVIPAAGDKIHLIGRDE